MEFLAFLQDKEFFSDEDCVIIDAAFNSITIDKGVPGQEVDKHSDMVIFIESGLLRTFYYKDGKDITHFFFDENYFVAPVDTIYWGEKAAYQWESVEPSKLKAIKFIDLMAIEERFPRISRVILDFSIQMNHLLSMKLNLVQFQTASDRYNLFLEMYPNLNNRVSLGDTASFLGVTQQTLSVIRGQKR